MADLDLEALERAVETAHAVDGRVRLHPDVVLALISRLRAAEAERDAALAAERKAHDAIARNDERHAEAIAAVRARAERAEAERNEARAALAERRILHAEQLRAVEVENAALRAVADAARELRDMPCEYGPRCEDCRVCRLRAALAAAKEGT